jgi:hypothetical protein
MRRVITAVITALASAVLAAGGLAIAGAPAQAAVNHCGSTYLGQQNNWFQGWTTTSHTAYFASCEPWPTGTDGWYYRATVTCKQGSATTTRYGAYVGSFRSTATCPSGYAGVSGSVQWIQNA